MWTCWFHDFVAIDNHLVETEWEAFPAEVRAPAELRGRRVIVRKCKVVPVECVARGYCVGSGLKEDKETGKVCGMELEPGLTTASRLREPIFTPATKEETGHDENISFERMCTLVGDDLAAQLRDLTLRIYQRAAAYAETRSIIIADTKFEFGIDQHPTR